jgi:hypothetical protein
MQPVREERRMFEGPHIAANAAADHAALDGGREARAPIEVQADAIPFNDEVRALRRPSAAAAPQDPRTATERAMRAFHLLRERSADTTESERVIDEVVAEEGPGSLRDDLS